MNDEPETMNDEPETMIEAQLPGMPLRRYADIRGRAVDNWRRKLAKRGHDVDGLDDRRVVALAIGVMDATPATVATDAMDVDYLEKVVLAGRTLDDKELENLDPEILKGAKRLAACRHQRDLDRESARRIPQESSAGK